ESKVGKVEKYFDEVPEAHEHVNLKVYSDRTGKAEVTIPLPNIVLRAEETSPDLYGSIDLVSDKLERQMRKYKTKINRKFRRQQAELPDAISPDLLEETKELDDEINEEVNGEVTIPLPNIVLRAEETSPDLYGSIDLVSDKLERQMRKYKTKINRKFRRQQAELPDAISPDLLEETKELDDEINEEVNGGV